MENKYKKFKICIVLICVFLPSLSSCISFGKSLEKARECEYVYYENNEKTIGFSVTKNGESGKGYIVINNKKRDAFYGFKRNSSKLYIVINNADNSYEFLGFPFYDLNENNQLISRENVTILNNDFGIITLNQTPLDKTNIDASEYQATFATDQNTELYMALTNVFMNRKIKNGSYTQVVISTNSSFLQLRWFKEEHSFEMFKNETPDEILVSGTYINSAFEEVTLNIEYDSLGLGVNTIVLKVIL